VKARSIAAANDVVVHVSVNIAPNFRTQPDNPARAFEYASLARATRLMLGMTSLFESGSDDVAQCLARPVFECWVIGTLLSLSPDEGLSALKNDSAFQHDRMGKAGSKEHAEFAKELTWERSAINWRRLSERVGILLQEQHGDTASGTANAYDVLYRPPSFTDLHSSMGALAGHISTEPTRFRVLMERVQQRSPLPLLMTAGTVVNLAARIENDIGRNLRHIALLGDRLVSLAEEVAKDLPSLEED
jgi:hypothetical protein